MKLSDLEKRLKSTKLPVGYLHFSEPESLPFILYGISGKNDFHGDNKHYFKITEAFVELYTDAKDEKTEEKVIRVFEKYDIPYGHEYETYIKKEGAYVVRWHVQILGG